MKEKGLKSFERNLKRFGRLSVLAAIKRREAIKRAPAVSLCEKQGHIFQLIAGSWICANCNLKET